MLQAAGESLHTCLLHIMRPVNRQIAIKPSCLHRSVCILPLAVAFFVHLFRAIYMPTAIKNNASTNTSLI